MNQFRLIFANMELLLMTKLIRAVTLFSILIVLSGCSSNPIKTEIVNIPNEKWRISSVVVSKHEDAWQVSGR